MFTGNIAFISVEKTYRGNRIVYFLNDASPLINRVNYIVDDVSGSGSVDVTADLLAVVTLIEILTFFKTGFS